MRKLHLLALAFLLVGGVLLFGPAFGFSSLTADRGVSVSTGDEDTAFLAYNHEEDIGTLDRGDDGVYVAELTNNLGDEMKIYAADLEIEITDSDGDTIGSGVLDVEFDDEDQNPVTFSPGSEVDLLLACGEEQDVGESEVTTKITNAQDTDETVTIAGVSFMTSVDIQCDGGGRPVGGGEIRAYDIDGDTQTFELGTTQQGSMQQATIDFSDVDFIDYSGAGLEVEGLDNGDIELDREAQEITFDEDPENQEAEITLTDITVEESGSAVVEFTEERTGNRESTDSDRFNAEP